MALVACAQLATGAALERSLKLQTAQRLVSQASSVLVKDCAQQTSAPLVPTVSSVPILLSQISKNGVATRLYPMLPWTTTPLEATLRTNVPLAPTVQLDSLLTEPQLSASLDSTAPKGRWNPCRARRAPIKQPRAKQPVFHATAGSGAPTTRRLGRARRRLVQRATCATLRVVWGPQFHAHRPTIKTPRVRMHA